MIFPDRYCLMFVNWLDKSLSFDRYLSRDLIHLSTQECNVLSSAGKGTLHSSTGLSWINAWCRRCCASRHLLSLRGRCIIVPRLSSGGANKFFSTFYNLSAFTIFRTQIRGNWNYILSSKIVMLEITLLLILIFF